MEVHSNLTLSLSFCRLGLIGQKHKYVGIDQSCALFGRIYSIIWWIMLFIYYFIKKIFFVGLVINFCLKIFYN